MKKYYEKYILQLQNGIKEFVAEENKNFPVDYDVYKRTISEYISFISFYKDSNSNEVAHLSNERRIIDKTLNTIRELISEQEYVLAQYHIISLQLYFDIEVKLKTVLATMILEDMNINSFLNIKSKLSVSEQENYGRIENSLEDNRKRKKK